MEIDLSKISTRAPEELNKKSIKEETESIIREIDDLQNILYAESKHSVLIVLQGLDASGKDGLIKKVFSFVNPQGVKVKSFKKPTAEELAHDFLWRVHPNTPEKGMIQIFNRSHYEDVLVTRVLGYTNDKLAEERFQIINAFEKNLELSGTVVLKFYLHISKEEQSERFKERLENPKKNWKYNAADLETSKDWDRYMEYYKEIFEQCSDDIPWEVVPSDQNWYKEFIIAKKLRDTLLSFNMEYPKYVPEK